MANKPSVADSDSVQYATIEDIEVAVRNNPSLLGEFSKLGEEKFLEKYLKKAGEADATAGNEPPVEDKATSETPDEEVTLKLSKKRFGDKDPMEALEEMEEQARIARELREERIPSLEGRLKKSEEERLSLVAELTAKKKSESAQIALPDEVKIDDFEGDDIFDAEKQKKLVGSLKSMATGYNTLAKKLTELEKRDLEKAEKDAIERQNRMAKQTGEEDRAAFDRLRKANPELFVGKREITDVQADYVKFMTGLGQIIGHKGEVLDPATGQFHPEVSKAYALYHDDKSGEELRKKAEASGIKLPKDFDDFLLYHQLNGVRDQNFKKDATGLRPYSWSEALDKYIAEQPVQKDPKVQAAREKKEKELQAIKNRERHARELPSDQGANPIDLTQVTDRDFALKLNQWKRLGKTEDRDWLESVMGTMQMPKDEIEQTLKR